MTSPAAFSVPADHEHDGYLLCSYLIDGARLPGIDRRAWLRDQLAAARDADTLEAMRAVERALMADGDMREAYAVARETLRAALVRRALREAVRPGR